MSSDGMDFDFSELTKLAADLGRIPDEAIPNVKTALNVTSLRVKRGAQAKVGRRKHFKQAAQAITFDVTARKSEIESEIGYDKARPAGKLGNLVEYGAPGSPNALTPGNELQTTLHEEEADFVKGLSKALEDAEKKAGL